ncbi:hypothetical protein ACOT19_03875 [Acinetobacter baumannii]|nr:MULTISPECIES: hypothetical protein [Acinetobacter]MCW1514348.1 hypothetical protein [Acinetobacter baumannii]MDA3551908.1 hypothetical protein [Acinetobacter sp. AOR11_HL]MDA4919920.1 hypothetical protein [Acinetobacter baumannii]MDI9740493.1 hypothetical protein [Acinetobacter baumannii]HAV5495930.1 hypothetical protein [Acinetobacter baumannii]
MAKTTYKTRAKAAEHLNTLDPSKTVVQWHTFLNDNARTGRRASKKLPQIPYKPDLNNNAMYKTADLEAFLKAYQALKLAQRQAEIEESQQCFRRAYGALDHSNDNSFGQCFGHRWEGASVNLIADNAERGQPNAVSLQLIINHPLRVSALTTVEAEAFAKEVLEAVEQAKRLGL